MTNKPVDTVIALYWLVLFSLLVTGAIIRAIGGHFGTLIGLIFLISFRILRYFGLLIGIHRASTLQKTASFSAQRDPSRCG